MKINDAVRTDAGNAGLCWLATVDTDGVPSVSPKEMFAVSGDDSLVIADIASSKSVRNIQENPHVCVSFVDIFRQRGFKVIGRASLLAPDDDGFDRLGADLLRRIGERFRVNYIICVHVSRIERIWAPSYRFYPETTEQEMMEDSYKLYGVRPAHETGNMT